MSFNPLFPRDSCMTPVKIRGKRKATIGEKWRVGKRRNPALQKKPGVNGPGSFSADSSKGDISNVPPKRKQVVRELSRMEDLPAELIQQIFILSGNPDLALSSPHLANSLSSEQLFRLMAMRLLMPILDATKEAPLLENSTLTSATRFLNAKFVSLSWFRTWLKRTVAELNDSLFVTSVVADTYWSQLMASVDLLPPKKLLRGPFTPDKTEFLGLFVGSASTAAMLRDPYYTELVQEGLSEAIKESNLLAVRHFLSMPLQLYTEHLRLAVTGGDCDVTIVDDLVSKYHENEASGGSEFDLLDPDVWTWIERAQAQGNEKGSLIKSILQAAQNA